MSKDANGNYSLTLAAEDWTDGDYNDGSVTVVLGKLQCYCPINGDSVYWNLAIFENVVAADKLFLSDSTFYISYNQLGSS